VLTAPWTRRGCPQSGYFARNSVRQIIAVLERFGIEPDGRLTAQDYAGLPLPAGLWE